MKLTPEEISRLKVSHKKERDKRICDRIKAVLLINDGYTYEQVAKILLIDDETARRHVREFLELEKLKNNNKGSNGKLNKEQVEELISYLKNNTYLGVKPIIKYIKLKYGVKYSKSGMNTWLNIHGFRYKKPHSVPCKHNHQKQLEFIKLMTNIKNSGEPFFYLDASHPSHQSKPSYGWIFIGSNKALPTTATQKRIHLTGALEFNTKAIFVSESDVINSQAVISLIDEIKVKYNSHNQLHFILDNAKYHKSIVIKEYLAQNKNIIFHYLPAYSPNLNIIERLWKFMHKKVTNNEYYEKFVDFKKAIMTFFETIPKYKDELDSLLTFKFQKLNYNVGNFVK